MSSVSHNCSVGLVHSPHDAHDMTVASKHRGNEAWGIAAQYTDSYNYRRHIDIIKALGSPEDVKKHTVIENLGTDGVFSIHTRYSTKRADGIKYALAEAHPRYVGGKTTKNKRHMIARDVDLAVVHNGTFCYDEELLEGKEARTDTEAFLMLYKKMGPEGIMKNTHGSFSSIVFDSSLDEVVLMRDRHETKPLVIGKKDGKFIAASEDSIILDVGGRPLRDVRGGEIIYISKDGKLKRNHQVVESDPHPCHFELIYLMRDDSSYYGMPVWHARHRLGNIIREVYSPHDVDIVTYIPNAPFSIAFGYDEEKFTEVFYKFRQRRSFQEPSENERETAIKNDLMVYDNIDLEGKNVLAIDDSIVRGNVSKNACMKLRQKGVNKIYLVSGAPMIGANRKGCDHGGVDMPSDRPRSWRKKSNFAIVKHGSPERMAEAIGADKVFFTPYELYVEWLGDIGLSSCKRCIGGLHPFYEIEPLK